MRSPRFSPAVFLAALPLFSLVGCGKKEVAKAPPKPTGPPTVGAEVLQKSKPNEAGAVMVIMYHRFIADEKESDLNRRPETFKKDLETLRAKNYYPVNAIDLVNNKMDIPAGKTPVVITFDDALPTQFRVIEKNGEAKIDPNCAVGIMENFSKKHPDWPMKATFFVLPKEGRNAEPFGQSETIADKFEYLVKKGYEVANHTSTHSSLRGMDVKKIQWELATAHKDIKAINDGVGMETLALPYGKMPRNEAAKKALLSGSDGGTSYEHKAVFLAAWRTVMSPISKADKKFTEGGSIALFETAGLERVTPDARNAKSPGTLEYWISYFDKNPNIRYVSDGVAEVAAVPGSLKNSVDESRAKAQGKALQFYGGGSTGSDGKKTGGGLSVN